jgi:hypothetical protein
LGNSINALSVPGDVIPQLAKADLLQKWLHSCFIFARAVAESSGSAMGVGRRIMRLTGFLALLALIGLGGCSASGRDPALETAYSAIGAQLK